MVSLTYDFEIVGSPHQFFLRLEVTQQASRRKLQVASGFVLAEVCDRHRQFRDHLIDDREGRWQSFEHNDCVANMHVLRRFQARLQDIFELGLPLVEQVAELLEAE